MTTEYRYYNSIQSRQERRIRWQHGLTETQARVLAPFIFGRVSK